MSRLRLRSAVAPLDVAPVAYLAARVLARLEAMGLLRGTGPISQLDWPLLETSLSQAAGHGVPTELVQLQTAHDDPNLLAKLLDRQLHLLEGNPAPTELKAAVDVLGSDLVAEVTGAGRSSLARYLAATRQPPDDLAWRVHILCLLIGDLAGSYNELGIRRWFARPRRELGGRTPGDLLRSTDDPAPLFDLTGPLVGAR